MDLLDQHVTIISIIVTSLGIIVAIAGIIFVPKIIAKRRHQIAKAGDNSTVVQSGRDTNIK